MIIKQLFRWSKSRKLIAVDPLEDVALKKPLRLPKPSPTLAEVEAVLTAAHEPLRSHLTLLAFTGMRSGELQRLRPENVDRTGNWIEIVSRVGAETNTRRSRKVPIHPRLIPTLDALSKKARPFLFTSAASTKYPKGGRPMNTKRLNDQFKRLLAKLDLAVGRESGYVIHSFRHFFETYTVNSGIPQRVIDAWLGHHGDKSIGAGYYKLNDEESQRFMQKLALITDPTTAVMPL